MEHSQVAIEVVAEIRNAAECALKCFRDIGAEIHKLEGMILQLAIDFRRINKALKDLQEEGL